MVWTSVNGADWTAVWGAPPTGSVPGEQLVVGPNALLLFNADEGTGLWVSKDAVTWTRIDIPEAMSALVLRHAVFGHGRFVAILNNKYAGGANTAYGEGDVIWTSTDGKNWTQDSVPGPPTAFQSVTPERSGFRIVGVVQQSGKSVAWSSHDGVTWSMTR